MSDPTTTTGSALRTALPMRTAAVVAWLLSVALTAIGTFVDLFDKHDGKNDSGELIVWLAMMAVLAVISYVVYTYWYGRATTDEAAATAALIGGVVSVLTIVVFWAGLPAIFAVGAVLLGLAAPGSKAKTGAVLGVIALAVAVYAAFYG